MKFEFNRFGMTMAKSHTWNALWWKACADLRGIDRETEARCVGNAMYANALAYGLGEAKARHEGHQAYKDAGGVTFRNELPQPTGE